MSHATKPAPPIPPPPAPVFQTVGKCPRCGRKSAVVFPLVHAAARPADAPLVCLACCPTEPGATGDREPAK
jgi:hypothetical protein